MDSAFPLDNGQAGFFIPFTNACSGLQNVHSLGQQSQLAQSHLRENFCPPWRHRHGRSERPKGDGPSAACCWHCCRCSAGRCTFSSFHNILLNPGLTDADVAIHVGTQHQRSSLEEVHFSAPLCDGAHSGLAPRRFYQHCCRRLLSGCHPSERGCASQHVLHERLGCPSQQ